MRVWLETVDDVVVAPEGMAVAGRVRRRTWKSQVAPRRWYELTCYLGRDADTGIPLVRWDCEVWDEGQPMDQMTSGVRAYGYRPTPDVMVNRMMQLISPSEVTGYSVWGCLMVGSRSL